MLHESTLIEKYFTWAYSTDTIRLSVGDDSAIVRMPPSMDLVVCTDTLVENVHFSKETSATAVGYKALAVNLSDIAAMGAQPKWMSLALTLNAKTPESWVAEFAQGLKALGEEYNIALIGGDITQGAINCISVCLKGLLPETQGVLRSGAKNGDNLYVTGTLGGAGYAWKTLASGKHTRANLPIEFKEKLERPIPRIKLGQSLGNIINSMMDLSDGLATDLPKLLKASKCGAHIDLDNLPLHPNLHQYASPDFALELAMAGGDDYELCLTASPQHHNDIQALAEKFNTPITCIGTITMQSDCIDYYLHGQKFQATWQGWHHFGES